MLSHLKKISFALLALIIITLLLWINENESIESFQNKPMSCNEKDEKNCVLDYSTALASNRSLNIFKKQISTCSTNPMTGYFRDGSCSSDKRDLGNHSVCATLTKEFLNFTKNNGNDLSTPNPRYGFPGLKPGDRWCLCAARFKEAKLSGINLNVDLQATSIRALEVTNEFE